MYVDKLMRVPHNTLNGGYHPFCGDNERELQRAVVKGKIDNSLNMPIVDTPGTLALTGGDVAELG